MKTDTDIILVENEFYWIERKRFSSNLIENLQNIPEYYFHSAYFIPNGYDSEQFIYIKSCEKKNYNSFSLNFCVDFSFSTEYLINERN